MNTVGCLGPALPLFYILLFLAFLNFLITHCKYSSKVDPPASDVITIADSFSSPAVSLFSFQCQYAFSISLINTSTIFWFNLCCLPVSKQLLLKYPALLYSSFQYSRAGIELNRLSSLFLVIYAQGRRNRSCEGSHHQPLLWLYGLFRLKEELNWLGLLQQYPAPHPLYFLVHF